LLDHMRLTDMAGFVARAKAHGLLVGLAGSLKPSHVPTLLPLQPSLLGFRSALCREGARNASIDPDACAYLRSLIPSVNGQDAEMPTLLSPALC
jgi:(5-formylfuran-3-yl)methyl phosphate synthase